MKSIGELMKEMGFNEEASFEAKKAFIKYMIQRDPKSSLKAPVLCVKNKLEPQMSFEDYVKKEDKEFKKSS